MTSLNNTQEQAVTAIYNYGMQNNFSDAQIQYALTTAYIESSLGLKLTNPNSTASGLYHYIDSTWDIYHSSLGEKNNLDNQITAFFNDLKTYYNWFNNPATNGNIPKSMTFEEYAYLKHHDGRNSTNFEDAPGPAIYREKQDEIPPDIDIPANRKPRKGSLAVDAEKYIGDGIAIENDPVGCIKVDAKGKVYIDYFLESYLTDEDRKTIIDSDPTDAFYIY